MKENPIILFDGICNFCNGAVQMIIKYDRKGIFRFASLQSSFGEQLLSTKPELKKLDTVILVSNGKIMTESTAALNILKELEGWPKVFYLFIVIPLPIRNFFYKLFAKYRYKMFGTSVTCMIPTKEIRNRFLS
ncbi:thiol-disulfide oxidoreductase DCC family protein [Bacillus sp. EAC]|uniref:thiol-disulfide oxidoreductase DCC family protein n=1 Tax=Bacillus sp. EAC TaxID=1978338 RepID=UPI00211AF885|nr:DCC1-like thiol-disulfide oxidoreductase family protein [Bacillus sp. EAC]